MKIKKKRQVRLDELIKYVWDNRITSTVFQSCKGQKINIGITGTISHDPVYYFNREDLFTITEEVEITDDMRLNLVVIDDECEATANHYTKISQILKEADTYGYDIKAMYLQNDDGKIGELIWEDGEFIG